MGPLTLPTGGSVYIDANAIIYSVERIEPYRELLAPMWQEAGSGRFALANSELVVLETLIKPLREGNARLEMLFRSIFAAAEMNLIPATLAIWEDAARIRAQTGLATPDALHAATALQAECTLFVTNDTDFPPRPRIARRRPGRSPRRGEPSMSLGMNEDVGVTVESIPPRGAVVVGMNGRSAASLPTETAHLGNLRLLNEPLTALFCSNRCPGDLILKTYDLARATRDAGVPVIGGFQTPMERECLRLLLRGTQPVVICPARGIQNMRTPHDWRPALDEDRLLVLSPFPSTRRRPTAELAAQRNELVASLATRVFIAHATPGSKTEAFARKLADSGKPLLTLNSPANTNLVEMGAEVFDPARNLMELIPHGA